MYQTYSFFSTRSFVLKFLILGILFVALTGCGRQIGPGFADFGVAPKDPVTQRFVEKSRPENLDYIPIEDPHKVRNPGKKPEVVTKVQEDMEMVKKKNEIEGHAATAEGAKAN